MDNAAHPVLGITTAIMVIAREAGLSGDADEMHQDIDVKRECPSPSPRVGHIALGVLLT